MLVLFAFTVALFAGSASVMQVKADSSPLELGPSSSVTVPLDNLMLTNLKHDYPVLNASEMVCLLHFSFDNGTDKAEIYYYLGLGLSLDGSKNWKYEIDYSENKYHDLLEFIGEGTNIVIVQNPDSSAAGVFQNVTIETFDYSSITVTAGTVSIEFDVTFQDLNGNTLSVIRTVNRYIPAELVPAAPQVDKRPFLRWMNIQGYTTEGIITSDAIFIPLYSYDPSYIVDDPQPATNESDMTTIPEILFIFAAGAIAILILRKVFK